MQFLRKLNKLGKIYIMLIIMGLPVGVLVSCNNSSEEIGTFTNNSNGDDNNGDDTSFDLQDKLTTYIGQAAPGKVDEDAIREYLQKVGPNTIMSGNYYWEKETPLTYTVDRFIGPDNNPPSKDDIGALKEVIDLLTDNGADINGVDGNGNTPLSIALSRGSQDIVNYILNAGATMPPADNGEYTALKSAVNSGNVDLVKFVKDQYPTVSLKDQRFDNGKTLFFFANTPNMFQYLFDEGVDINEKDQAGDYSWRHILRNNNSVVSILEILNTNGADFDVSFASASVGSYKLLYSPLQEIFSIHQNLNQVNVDAIKKLDELGKIGLGAGQMSPNAKIFSRDGTDSLGPVLSWLFTFWGSIFMPKESDRLELVKILIDAGADLLSNGKDNSLTISQLTSTPVELINESVYWNAATVPIYSEICEYFKTKLTPLEQANAGLTCDPPNPEEVHN